MMKIVDELGFDIDDAEVVQASSTFLYQRKNTSANLVFRSIDSTTANSLLTEHYLGSVPTTRVLCSYTDGEAVAIYGRPTTGNVRFGCKTQELMRLWSPDVYSGVLYSFLSKTVQQLRKDFSEVQLLVAYAAPEVNHHGGIYRASNWFYAGKASQGGPQALIINGEIVHTRTVNHRYGHANRKRLEQELGIDITPIKRVQKHTYYYPLNKKIRAILREKYEGNSSKN